MIDLPMEILVVDVLDDLLLDPAREQKVALYAKISSCITRLSG